MGTEGGKGFDEGPAGMGMGAGACTPGGYHVNWGVDGAGVGGTKVGAARARAAAFRAALRASGAAARPELTPPL